MFVEPLPVDRVVPVVPVVPMAPVDPVELVAVDRLVRVDEPLPVVVEDSWEPVPVEPMPLRVRALVVPDVIPRERSITPTLPRPLMADASLPVPNT